MSEVPFYIGELPIQPPLFTYAENPCPMCGSETKEVTRSDLGIRGPGEDDVRSECDNPRKTHMMHNGSPSTIYDKRGCGWYGGWHERV